MSGLLNLFNPFGGIGGYTQADVDACDQYYRMALKRLEIYFPTSLTGESEWHEDRDGYPALPPNQDRYLKEIGNFTIDAYETRNPLNPAQGKFSFHLYHTDLVLPLVQIDGDFIKKRRFIGSNDTDAGLNITQSTFHKGVDIEAGLRDAWSVFIAEQLVQKISTSVDARKMSSTEAISVLNAAMNGRQKPAVDRKAPSDVSHNDIAELITTV